MAKKPVKDVFGIWQFKEAVNLVGKYQIPEIYGTYRIPDALVPFSKCGKETETQNKAVHFYEFDEKFVPAINSEAILTRKLEIFRRYQSVILPDCSVYRDFPLAVQIHQVFRSRAVGNFLMRNGINVIPNVRWGDERTYEFAFDGISTNAVVAVGAQGGYGDDEETKDCFKKGFMKMLHVLHPQTVLCYGNISDDLRNAVEYEKVKIRFYPTEISKRTAKKRDPQTKLEF